MRQIFSHFGKIISRFLASVTTGHNYKSFYGSGFDRGHNLVGQRQNLVVSKTADNLAGFNLGRGGTFFCLLNYGGKIFFSTCGSFRNMVGPDKTDNPSGKEAVKVGVIFFQRNNAVRSHQDRAVKGFKFLILVPPGAAVIANQVIIFFQFRIVVTRQHLAMGVDINARSFGLFQELFHVL